MARNDIKYTEIARAAVTDARNVVISYCSKGGYTIAQQLVANEGAGRDTTVYLKGAFHVDDIHGLYNLRDALNIAIHQAESNAAPPDTWDE